MQFRAVRKRADKSESEKATVSESAARLRHRLNVRTQSGDVVQSVRTLPGHRPQQRINPRSGVSAHSTRLAAASSLPHSAPTPKKGEAARLLSRRSQRVITSGHSSSCCEPSRPTLKTCRSHPCQKRAGFWHFRCCIRRDPTSDRSEVQDGT